MPANLPYETIFNATFLGIIGLGFLIGLIRGFRKSLYSLVVAVIFYGIFFLTIDAVVNQLWVLPLPFVFANLEGVMPGLGSAQTLGDALSIALEAQFGDMVGDLLTNEQFISFITGIALFVVKLIYTLLYFTIFLFIYRLITWIIRLTFFGRTQAEEDYKLAMRQIKKMKLKGRDLRRKKKTVRMEFKKMFRKERKMQIKQDKKMNNKRQRNKEFKRIKKETKLAIKQMSRKERRQQTKEEKLRQQFILKNGYYFSDRQLTQFMDKPSKMPLLGALAGGAKGVLSVFVTMIMLGGLISIMESVLQVLPEDQPTVSREYMEEVYLANGPVSTNPQLVPMAETSPFAIPTELEGTLDTAREMIDAFNNNMVVSNLATITYTDENYDGDVPMHLYLFDSVLSFSYREEKIMLRAELDTFSDTAAVLINSEFASSNDLADITQDDIISLFDTISNSRLITTLLPVIIEAGSEVYDVPIEVPVEELYEIDWQSELQALGSVAAVGFDIINTAGILNDEADLTQVTLDGDTVQGFFDSLGDSELVTLTAYVAVEPLLEQMGGQISAIITVPDNIVWEDEFSAFGLVAKAVLDTGITMDQLQSGDPMSLISSLADLDFTVLLNSQIVTQAMINIFSGDAGIEGLDMIIIPSGINWRDLVDGEDIIRGELYNILNAINAINALTDVAEGFSFDNISLSVIADFDEATIDTIFESSVLVATISNFITNELDFGDTPLIIPDSVFDTNGYITNVEMKAVANSARVLVTDLPCDVGDVDCESIGFDLDAVFTLSTTSIDTMVASDIIGATIGNLIIDQAGDVLTIPSTSLDGILVDSVQTFVVSPGEISSLFASVSVLEFESIDTLTFDIGILNRLALDADPTVLDDTKTDTLFGSQIVHATISDLLIDLDETDDILSVPYFAEDDTTPIRYTDSESGTDFVSTDELDAVLQALISLDLEDFDSIDGLDLNLIIDNSAEILSSSILQATITKQVLELGGDIITVPFEDEDGLLVRVTVGNAGEGTETAYITVDEINAILDALSVLDIGDISTFDGAVDIGSVLSKPGGVDTLLASATIQATISKQLFDLESDGTLAVPYLKEDDTTPVRVSVGVQALDTDSEYITEAELRALLDVLDLLGIAENLDSFDGAVDLGVVLEDPANYDILLASATIHATISQQLVDLAEPEDPLQEAALVVPYFAEDGTTAIRITVGNALNGTETFYIKESEVRAMLDVLDLLGIADNLDTFDGAVDLSAVLGTPANYDILLASATIHATISQQLFDLETDGTLAVPYLQQDDLTLVRVTVGDEGDETDTEYITENEVRALLDVLDLLGIADNLDTFDGAVDLSLVLGDSNNYDILLASATIHATISQQLFDLETDGTLAVPYLEEDDVTEVRVSVGDDGDGTNTDYIVSDEVRALLDVLDLLGIADDLANFNGDINLGTVLSDPANYDILLASATIHATISQQLFDLAEPEDPLQEAALVVPYFDDDDTTEIRITVGTGIGHETNYITADEVRALLDVLDLLGIADNLDTFDGAVDLSAVLGNPANYDTLLASATIHATISQQLFDLGTDGTLVVPYLEENNSTLVRLSVGDALEDTDTEYITDGEVRALLDALDVLGIADNLDTFDGGVDIASATQLPGNIAILLSSSTIQATISRQMIDLDVAETLEVPYFEEDGLTLVRKSVGTLGVNDTEYISAIELEALFTALKTLGITNDIETFDGSVDLSILDQDGNPGTPDDGKVTDVVSSAILQATISKQIIDIETSATVAFVVPYFNDDETQDIRIEVGTDGNPDYTSYVWSLEIKNIIKGMRILGISDVTTFNGDIDLTNFFEETPRNTLLSSSIMQATISKQLLDLGSGVLLIPEQDVDGLDIRLEVGVVLDSTDTEFVSKDEIGAMFEALETLGFTNVNDFAGTIDLTNVYGTSNQDVILASAAMHATISDQMINLGTAALDIPDNDVSSTSIKLSVGPSAPEETSFIIKDEIKALIDALEVLGINDIESFSGSFDFTALSSSTNQDILLASASLHKTITNKLLDLDDSILIVPTHEEDTVTELRITAVATEFVAKGEIKSLIDAFTAMGYNNLDSFGASLDSSEFFSNRATLLASSSIQATLSDKLLNGTGGFLLIPDNFYGTADLIRIPVGAVTYVESGEIDALMAGLEAMGLTDFGSFSGSSFGAGSVLSADFSIVLQSKSLQVTISDSILGLATTLDENDAYTMGRLVVPTTFRQAIDVNAISKVQILNEELLELLGAMSELGFSDFGSSIGGSAITSMNDTTLDEMFDSGSIHKTLDSMLRANAALDIPTDAEEDRTVFTVNLTDYILSDVTTEAEIRYFLTAVTTLGEGDFSSVTFDLSDILALDVGQQDTIATSMIVRYTLHSEVYTTATQVFVPNPFRALVAGDFMSGVLEVDANTSFFTKSTFLEAVQHDYLTP